MNKNDWIFVGLKLIGVCLATWGAISLFAMAGLIFFVMRQREFTTPAYIDHFLTSWHQYLQPIVYLVCAFMLIRRTDWCMSLVCPELDDGGSDLS